MATFSYLWTFRVRPERVDEFLHHYGPAGAWAQLFRRSPGYLGTRLLRDVSDPERFTTADRWWSRAAYESFRALHAGEFAALDATCEAFTLEEEPLGYFEEVAVAPFERQRDPYTVSTDPARLDFEALHAILSRSYWSPNIPADVLARGVGHSLAFGLYRGDTMIGFARAITDKATFAYLADVYVREDQRGQGLGLWLVECVLDHDDLRGLRRLVLVTRDAHGLYAKLGFEPLAAPQRYMEIVRPAAELYGAGPQTT